MKNPNLSEATLIEFSQFLKEKFALNYPKEKYRDLERGITGIMILLNENNPEVCLNHLKRGILTSDKIELITTHFTIGETYFFREPATFQALREHILPDLIQSRRNSGKIIRIWSAGCASGEEPYTIAMILSELIPDWQDWNITLLATDINHQFIRKLHEGVYTEWSFRNNNHHIKEKYFTKCSNNRYQIKPSIKKMVTAEYLNLAEDCYPDLFNNTNGMDIIFCRNLLMYFVPDLINRVMDRFKQSLIEGGYLVVGSSEHSLVPKDEFFEVKINDAIFYQKSNLSSFTNLTSLSDSSTEEHLLNQKFNNNLKFKKTISESSLLEKKEKNQKKEISSQFFSKNNQVQDINLNKNKEEIELQSRMLANQGKLQEALLVLNNGIVNDKFNPNFHYLKAMISLELGNKNDAITELNKTVYLDPKYILAFFSLGLIYNNDQQLKMAKKNFKIVLSLVEKLEDDEEIPGSEGLTVERIKEIIKKLL